MRQGARTQILFDERREWLFSQLPADIGVAILEHGEELGRRFLSVIPFSEQLSIPDNAMRAALRVHTFQMNAHVPPVAGLGVQHARCVDCAAPDINVLHNDVCPRRATHQGLHDNIVRAMQNFIGDAPSTVVLREQPVRPGRNQRRTDLTVSGTAASDGSRREFDVTVTGQRAPFAGIGLQRSNASYVQRPSHPGTPRTRVERARNILISRLVEKENHKFRSYPGVAGFRPFVLTINGARGPASDQDWTHWKSACSSMSLLTRTILVLLAETRGSRYVF